MTFKELQDYINGITDDASVAPFVADWINLAILQVASDVELPALRRVIPAAPITVDQSNWIWPMPADFHKLLFRCGYLDSSTGKFRNVTVHDRISDLELRDHALVRDQISSVATFTQEDPDGTGEKAFLGIYPLPTAPVTLLTWYYQLPRKLVKPTDVCGCIPLPYHERVIPPYVIVKNYQTIVDQVVNVGIQGLTYWEGKVNEGMVGREGGPLGLRYYLAKLKGRPRRTGGRDPVGFNPHRYAS
jgi:hypothetical protein